MAFIPVSGAYKVEWFPKAASTAMTVGSILKANGSGAVTSITSTDTSAIGVLLKPIASTDFDYASTTSVPLCLPTSETVFLADVGSGTATAANVGNRYDLVDATSVDLGNTSHKQVTVVGFIDSSHLLVKINAAYPFVNAA